MTITPDSLNPSSSAERREQTAAFLEQFWKGGEAVGKYGAGWYELALAAWLAACDFKDGKGSCVAHPKHLLAECPHPFVDVACECKEL